MKCTFPGPTAARCCSCWVWIVTHWQEYFGIFGTREYNVHWTKHVSSIQPSPKPSRLAVCGALQQTVTTHFTQAAEEGNLSRWFIDRDISEWRCRNRVRRPATRRTQFLLWMKEERCSVGPNLTSCLSNMSAILNVIKYALNPPLRWVSH